MREANEYKCTVHTLEIKPKLKAEYLKREMDWIKLAGGRFPFYSIKQGRPANDPRVIINPHKMFTAYDGEKQKFVFEYRKMDVIEECLAEMVKLTNTDGYEFKRVDICLDCDKPYEANEKIIRLIELMITTDWKKNKLNLFTSYDPLTLDMKSTTCNNNVKYEESISVEHYNREVMSQDDWINPPIRNRFELRFMWRKLEGVTTLEEVADKWLTILDALDKKRMNEVTDALTEAVYRRWVMLAERLGRVPKNNMRNHFYAFMSGYIFTHRQVKALYEMDGEGDAVKNVLRSDRLGNLFELYTYDDVKAEIKALKRALLSFMGRVSKKTRNGKS